jgi:hypothetical protein
VLSLGKRVEVALSEIRRLWATVLILGCEAESVDQAAELGERQLVLLSLGVPDLRCY